LKKLNQEHLATRENESELAARIYSYELAYRMQTAASGVVDLSIGSMVGFSSAMFAAFE
jgi:hypothetical protein